MGKSDQSIDWSVRQWARRAFTVVMAIDEMKWIHGSQDAPEEEDRPAVLCVVA